jgi:hypothetical protein
MKDETGMDMKRRIVGKTVRAALGIAVATALSGCAGLQGQPDGPGDCVGPPGFCVPYFGANAISPAMKPARAYASLGVSPAQTRTERRLV